MASVGQKLAILLNMEGVTDEVRGGGKRRSDSKDSRQDDQKKTRVVLKSSW